LSKTWDIFISVRAHIETHKGQIDTDKG